MYMYMYIYIVILLVLIVLWKIHFKEDFISNPVLDTTGDEFGFEIKGDLCLGTRDDKWCFKDKNSEFTITKNDAANEPDKGHFIVNNNGDLYLNRSVYRGWIAGELKNIQETGRNATNNTARIGQSVRLRNLKRSEEGACAFLKNGDSSRLIFSCDNWDWEAFRFV